MTLELEYETRTSHRLAEEEREMARESVYRVVTVRDAASGPVRAAGLCTLEELIEWLPTTPEGVHVVGIEPA
jgi:hypothetical protein